MIYLISKQASEGQSTKKQGEGEARARYYRAPWARIDTFWSTLRTGSK